MRTIKLHVLAPLAPRPPEFMGQYQDTAGDTAR